MAPHFQLDAAKYAVILSGARFSDLARNRDYFVRAGAGPIFDVASRASEIWLGAKIIQVPVAPPAIITTRFIAQAGS